MFKALDRFLESASFSEFASEKGDFPHLLNGSREGGLKSKARADPMLDFIAQMAFEFVQHIRGFDSARDKLLAPCGDSLVESKHIFRSKGLPGQSGL